MATDQQPSLKHGRLAWSWKGVIGDFESGCLKDTDTGALVKLFEQNKRDLGLLLGIDSEMPVSGRRNNPSLSISENSRSTY